MNDRIGAIFSVLNNNSNHFFRVDDTANFYDCHETCIIWNEITLYGVKIDLMEEGITDFYEGNYNNLLEIGHLRGCLILCKNMLDEGWDPWEVCDDVHGDLEYTISALSDENGPLNINKGEPYQDVYYIDEYKPSSENCDDIIKSRIINELPNLIFNLLHVKPDLIAYYPLPREYEVDVKEKERYLTLQNIASKKVSAQIDIEEEEDKNNEDERVIDISSIYNLSENEIDMIMGRRNSTSTYPENAKDLKDFSFYIENGFLELGSSRLLYKECY